MKDTNIMNKLRLKVYNLMGLEGNTMQIIETYSDHFEAMKHWQDRQIQGDRNAYVVECPVLDKYENPQP